MSTAITNSMKPTRLHQFIASSSAAAVAIISRPQLCLPNYSYVWFFISLNGLVCANVPLRNYSLTHSFTIVFKKFQQKWQEGPTRFERACRSEHEHADRCRFVGLEIVWIQDYSDICTSHRHWHRRHSDTCRHVHIHPYLHQQQSAPLKLRPKGAIQIYYYYYYYYYYY